MKWRNDGCPTSPDRLSRARGGGAADREDELVLGIGIELIRGADDDNCLDAYAGVRAFACSMVWKVSV